MLLAAAKVEDSVYVPAPPTPVPRRYKLYELAEHYSKNWSALVAVEERFVVYVPVPPVPVPNAEIVAVPDAVLFA
jgi:hypothetical protein